MQRQIILDTETTGLSVEQGHRLIEIGAIELNNRRPTGQYFHCYLNPEREVEPGAVQIHGLTNDFLKDKPLFHEVVEEFLAFVNKTELIIHNAPFDVGFINYELLRLKKNYLPIDKLCSIFDTLKLARRKHPGQSNNLDSLCRRYQIDNTKRELHGALLDAKLLSQVYLSMTGGKTNYSKNKKINHRLPELLITVYRLAAR